MTTTDIDAFCIPPFSVYDGIEGFYADDDRAVGLWSHYHAKRVNTCLRVARARIRVFEWQLIDVTPRGDVPMIERAQRELNAARADLAAWEAKRDLLEAARAQDSYAPRDWHWT